MYDKICIRTKSNKTVNVCWNRFSCVVVSRMFVSLKTRPVHYEFGWISFTTYEILSVANHFNCDIFIKYKLYIYLKYTIIESDYKIPSCSTLLNSYVCFRTQQCIDSHFIIMATKLVSSFEHSQSKYFKEESLSFLS